MVAVHDEHRACAAAVGAVDDHAAVARLLYGTLDRRGIRADDRDETRRRHHVSEADVDELHFGLPPFLMPRRVFQTAQPV